MFVRRRTATLVIAFFIVLLTFASSAIGIMAICAECEIQICKFVIVDGRSSCYNLPGGCIAWGECTINLRYTE